MLLQMSGVPGSGKSTLARAIGAHRGWVVVDTDVLKSSLLTRNVPFPRAGRLAYTAALALAGDLLAQGHGVVVDSPCRYRELLEGGQEAARRAGVPHRFVELWADDVAVLLERLEERTPLPSQVASSTLPAPGTEWEHGTAAATLAAWQQQLIRPDRGWLRLDASHSAHDNLRRALTYLEEPQ